MSSLVLSSRIAKGFYPERQAEDESKLDRAAVTFLGNVTRWLRARPGRFANVVSRINAEGAALKDMTDHDLGETVKRLQSESVSGIIDLDRVVRIFALVREVAGRSLGMRHFDVQLIGGLVLLSGMVAEMETGEGKTLMATLPACTAALAGIPVHIITVNDYLAKRDAEWMRPIYAAFGLSVGIVTQGMNPGDRREAYRCAVTYCTNKEIVFDYLKDRLLLGQRPGEIQIRLEQLYGGTTRLNRLLLRGLTFAIVDEADSVLIDEARTPLIISGPVDNSFEQQIYAQALKLSEQLVSDDDYVIDYTKKSLDLTDRGKNHLKLLTEPLGGLWISRVQREELVRQALVAQHLFLRDREYIIRDDKVQIVDEYTGRTMADRSWEQGLHQLIETKEGCAITAQNKTMARISYQRFFRRYLHLSGMTGTAREVANELWSVYRLHVATVPTNKPVRRYAHPVRICRNTKEKWDELVKMIGQLHADGRPLLVGTRSVDASEHLSAMLTAAGLPHCVLNARQDKDEAAVIAQAGQKAQITIATNMAGRGTDISLGPAVKELGGLHVILTEHHDSKRVDRQLFGRCGRQGEPGSFQAIVSLQDGLFMGYNKTYFGRIARRWVTTEGVLARRIGSAYVSYVQRAAQRKHFHMRRDLMKLDEYIEKAVAFSGRGD
jgi:preprotein translocase subunit SecA